MVVFEIIDGKLRPSPIQERGEFTSIHPLWVEICKASQAERLFVGGHFGVDLADPSETTDLEVSARFRVEANDAIHLHSNFLLERQGEPHSVPVSFVLHTGVIFSVHNEELPIFRLLRLRAATQPGYVSIGIDILLDLYGADVEYSAGALEEIYQRLGMVGRQVLHETMTDKIAASILSAIADQEDRNGRIRSNILDTQRALSFLMWRKLLSPSQTEDTRQIMRDIESLGSHTSFLFDKINFLMDATVGFINVNQNHRVNQLTFLSVVFMPINVLAGIGGMSEFSMMTRSIPWPLAYGSFVVVMGLVGYGTYLIVKSLENRKLVKKATKAPGSKRLLAR